MDYPLWWPTETRRSQKWFFFHDTFRLCDFRHLGCCYTKSTQMSKKCEDWQQRLVSITRHNHSRAIRQKQVSFDHLHTHTHTDRKTCVLGAVHYPVLISSYDAKKVRNSPFTIQPVWFRKCFSLSLSLLLPSLLLWCTAKPTLSILKFGSPPTRRRGNREVGEEEEKNQGQTSCISFCPSPLIINDVANASWEDDETKGGRNVIVLRLVIDTVLRKYYNITTYSILYYKWPCTCTKRIITTNTLETPMLDYGRFLPWLKKIKQTT